MAQIQHHYFLQPITYKVRGILYIYFNMSNPILHTGFDLAQPVTSPNVRPDSASGALSASTYQYKISFVTRFGETTCGPASSAATPLNGSLLLTNIPTDSVSNAQARRIYRTGAGNTLPFRFVATLDDNITTTYTDITADGDLGTVESQTNFAASVETNQGWIQSSRPFIHSADFTITATGTDHATSAQITQFSEYVFAAVPTPGTGIKMPPVNSSMIGMKLTIRNTDVTNALNIYPFDSAGAVGTLNPYVLPSITTEEFLVYDNMTWVLVGTGGNSGHGAVVTFSGGSTGLLPAIPMTGAITLTGDLNVPSGGTGNTSFAAGGILYGNGMSPLGVSFAGPGQLLTSGGGSAPVWTGPITYNGTTLTGLPAPTNASDIATKSYVDATGSNLRVHKAVRLAAVGSLTSIYNNGAGGVGATLTNSDVQAVLAVDGITPTINDRILVNNQTPQSQNGVYDVTDIGSVSTNWVLTRSADFDNSPLGEISPGDFVFVEAGNTLASTGWTQIKSGTGAGGSIIVGTDAISFAQVSGAGTYLAGTSINIVGNTISNTGVITVTGGSSGLTFSPTAGNAVLNGGILLPAFGGTGNTTNTSTNSNITDLTTAATYYPIFAGSTGSGSKPLDINSASFRFIIGATSANNCLILGSTIAIGSTGGTASAGTTSVAVGQSASAGGSNSGAFGISSSAGLPGANAIGGFSNASATNSTAVGTSATAGSTSATAVGNSANASGSNSGAFGAGSSTSAPGAYAIGNGATASGNNSTAVGSSANATSSGSIAIGNLASATTSSGIAIGPSASAISGIAIGPSSSAGSANNNVAIGNTTVAAGGQSVAIGTFASAPTGTASIAIGYLSSSSGPASIAFGQSANATLNNGISIGNGSSSTAQNATAIGRSSIASISTSLAIGDAASCSAVNALAVGPNASASGTSSLAIGSSATASGSSAIAFGQGSQASAASSIIIGVSAGSATSTGLNNIAIGASSLTANTSGQSNVCVGRSTMSTNTTGTQNVVVGTLAMQRNISGSDNTAFGTSTLSNNKSGGLNCGFGSSALLNNTTGNNNCGYGNNTISNNTTGNNNTGVGFNALRNHGVLTFSLGSASQSATTISGSGTTWRANMVGGTIVFNDLTQAPITAFVSATQLTSTTSQTVAAQTYHIYYGPLTNSAGTVSQTGTVTTGVGTSFTAAMETGWIVYSTGQVAQITTFTNSTTLTVTPSQTVAAGTTFILYYSTINDNAAFGNNALFSNTTASQLCAFGSNALSNSIATQQCAFGYNALTNVNSGGSNSAFGYSSGSSVTTGADNTILGNSAGTTLTTGSKNAMLGSLCNVGPAVSGALILGYSYTNTVANTAVVAPNGTEVFRTLDPATGGFTNKLVKTADATAAITLTPAIALGGYLDATAAGAVTVTLDTGANFDANVQLAGGLYVGLSFRCTVVSSNATGIITFATAVGITIKGTLTQPANKGTNLLFYRTGAATWDVVIC